MKERTPQINLCASPKRYQYLKKKTWCQNISHVGIKKSLKNLLIRKERNRHFCLSASGRKLDILRKTRTHKGHKTIILRLVEVGLR